MDDLRDRVEAVERALTDGEGDLAALAEGAAAAERVAALEAEVDELREEVSELGAATQALRGYVGNVRSVNESVEERADAALAAVESLEQRLEAPEKPDGSHPMPSAQSGEAAETRPGTAEPMASGDGTQSAARRDACRACGRPTNGSRTADGGRPSGGTETGRVNGTSPSEGSTTRRPLEGFDPNAAGPRVTVREAPDDERGRSTERRDPSAGAGTAGDGLVARLRARL